MKPPPTSLCKAKHHGVAIKVAACTCRLLVLDLRTTFWLFEELSVVEWLGFSAELIYLCPHCVRFTPQGGRGAASRRPKSEAAGAAGPGPGNIRHRLYEHGRRRGLRCRRREVPSPQEVVRDESDELCLYLWSSGSNSPWRRTSWRRYGTISWVQLPFSIFYHTQTSQQVEGRELFWNLAKGNMNYVVGVNDRLNTCFSLCVLIFSQIEGKQRKYIWYICMIFFM